MNSYLRTRLLLTIPTVIAITFFVYGGVEILPGGGPAAIACGEYCTDEDYAAIKESMGLDRPFVVRYLSWLGDMARGDFGTSIVSSDSIGGEIASRAPVTIELGVLGILISCLIALPIGVISAVRQDSMVDYVIRGLSTLLIAIPSFWMAIMLIAFGSRSGFWTPSLNYIPITEDPIGNLQMVIVPAVLLGLTLSGTVMRLTRTQMLEVLRQDYIRTARAKGLSPRTVISGHALRNAMIPVITVIGLQVPVVIGGSVILESIFNLPGLGRYAIDAIVRLDLPVLMTVNVVGAVVVVFANLATDCAYSIVDPRVSLK